MSFGRDKCYTQFFDCAGVSVPNPWIVQGSSVLIKVQKEIQGPRSPRSKWLNGSKYRKPHLHFLCPWQALLINWTLYYWPREGILLNPILRELHLLAQRLKPTYTIPGWRRTSLRDLVHFSKKIRVECVQRLPLSWCYVLH